MGRIEKAIKSVEHIADAANGGFSLVVVLIAMFCDLPAWFKNVVLLYALVNVGICFYGMWKTRKGK